MAIEIKIPEVGENIEKGTVARILVAPGDSVQEGDTLLELETDKAVVEIPVEQAGVVEKVLVSEGEEVHIGQTIILLNAAEETGEATAPEVAEEPASEATETDKLEEVPPLPSEAEEKPQPPQSTAPPPVAEAAPVPPSVSPAAGRPLVPAAPSVRRFAREIGIDITSVPGSGPGGRISIEDVKRYAKELNQKRTTGAITQAPQPLPDFSKWGAVERKPMNNVRRITAERLSYAWNTIPHVTNFDKANITRPEQLRKQYASRVDAAGGKLTVTAILLKITAAALKKFPQFNASIDMENQEIIYKQYINIGVAVDTPSGLLVPVVKQVDKKNLIELSVELTTLAQKARERKLTPDDMQGGNFSISNLGGIGGTGFTPIVNPPEVAILGISRASIEPLWEDGEFKPALMLPLSLSYDHRLIDGADAARFLRWIVQALEEPFLLSLEG